MGSDESLALKVTASPDPMLTNTLKLSTNWGLLSQDKIKKQDIENAPRSFQMKKVPKTFNPLFSTTVPTTCGRTPSTITRHQKWIPFSSPNPNNSFLVLLNTLHFGTTACQYLPGSPFPPQLTHSRCRLQPCSIGFCHHCFAPDRRQAIFQTNADF